RGRAGRRRARRRALGALVSRDPRALDASGVAAATTESVLENGNDAVFATLFWFLVAGAPGALAHRLANTLDAMWGYRSPRLRDFGRTAAHLDDLLGWLPARLTALTYTAVSRRPRAAWRCLRTQARQWPGPNPGAVLAAGAGALGVTLGGPTPYPGGVRQRPHLGAGAAAEPATIARATALLQRGALL
ncbi:cobalamin biosynthesis protein, partial [Halorhodospira neutriphila]|uniref:cobalamin biosynthesis protein n=1 Tax=Halorhodospira neutriphila TaxID=168379 RepID=UPI0019070B56